MQGIHSIYKPKGPTSHDVIFGLRKITGIRTIGHAGTLDPMARGILVVGVGRWAVRKLGKELAKEKEYTAKIKFGEESSTDDAEGTKKKIIGQKPTLKDIKETIIDFKGKIKQKPPSFSAVKIKGTRAYKTAAKGKALELKLRNVNIKQINILKYKWPYLDLKIVCGPGTYIRSLARDMGKRLKTGAYLADLERTRIGNHSKDKSWTLKKFKKEFEKRKVIMTLCLAQKNNKILLGLKKRDFGKGRWNGFGGKVKKGESMDSLIKREIREESGLRVSKYKKRGVFLFEFVKKPEILQVHLFSILKYEGKPVETDEMKPKWFELDKIPYKNMWPDDKFWLPLFLKGKNLRGEFYFKNINSLFHYSLREVKNFK